MKVERHYNHIQTFDKWQLRLVHMPSRLVSVFLNLLLRNRERSDPRPPPYEPGAHLCISVYLNSVGPQALTPLLPSYRPAAYLSIAVLFAPRNSARGPPLSRFLKR